MNRRAVLLAAVLALALWPAPAAADGEAALEAVPEADCAPEVRQALADSARAGVERDVAILRHPDQGIRDPDSILDFSCLDDLFDFGRFDILFDPGISMAHLLGLVQRRICAAAREAYRGYVGRPLDDALYTARDLQRRAWEPVREVEDAIRSGGADRFRRIVGEQPGRTDRGGGVCMAGCSGRSRIIRALPRRVVRAGDPGVHRYCRPAGM